jgi:hypothetical protein
LKPVKAEINYGDCSFEFDTCGWRSVNPGNALENRPQVSFNMKSAVKQCSTPK